MVLWFNKIAKLRQIYNKQKEYFKLFLCLRVTKVQEKVVIRVIMLIRVGSENFGLSFRLYTETFSLPEVIYVVGGLLVLFYNCEHFHVIIARLRNLVSEQVEKSSFCVIHLRHLHRKVEGLSS